MITRDRWRHQTLLPAPPKAQVERGPQNPDGGPIMLIIWGPQNFMTPELVGVATRRRHVRSVLRWKWRRVAACASGSAAAGSDVLDRDRAGWSRLWELIFWWPRNNRRTRNESNEWTERLQRWLRRVVARSFPCWMDWERLRNPTWQGKKNIHKPASVQCSDMLVSIRICGRIFEHSWSFLQA